MRPKNEVYSVVSVFIGLLLATMPLAANAQTNDIPNLGLVQHASGGYAPDSVIVKFRPSANASKKARARGLVNATSHRGYDLVKGLESLKLKPGQSISKAVNRLKNLPFVEFAEPDYLVQANTNDTYYDLLYAIDNTGQSVAGSIGTADADMNVREAWSIQTGDPSLIIAVIDEGVQYNHPDLDANMWVNLGEIPSNGIDDDGNGFIDDVHGYDFFANDGDPMDEGGHGTHVAGTICAETTNATGIAGVVQQCKIMALRFLGSNGGSTSGAIASLDYAVQMGATISNNSWGGGGYSTALYQSIAAARDADHIFLAAAGNDGTNNDSTPHYPSNYDLTNIISVAATDNRDARASFSNYGAVSVDIGAPGVDIASSYITDSYVYLSGTSMATPNVTGVVALIRSEFPDWGYQQVIDHLYATARPAASMNGRTTTGSIANAAAALAGGEPPTPPAAPSDLSAQADSDSAISLSWTDNSDNESVFVIERNGEVLPSTASANTTSYQDTGLAGTTTYTYQVKARNTAGDSDRSNGAEATTESPPPYQTILVSGEASIAGSIVAGNYARTFYLDDSLEQIRETESGGNPSKRHSYLEHRWTMSVPSGAASLSVTGYADNSSDGDSFDLAYSTGTAYNTFCTLAVGAAAPCSVSFDLPSASTLTLRVTDTNQSRGARDLDSVYIDQIVLLIESNTGPVTSPLAPENLSGDASSPGVISLTWTDMADNETSYDVQRSENDGTTWTSLASLGANAESFSDDSVASLTTYAYRVLAGNSAGNAASNTVVITSLEQVAPSISLSAVGSKTKGWQNVVVNWEAEGALITLYRNNSQVYQGNDSTFPDSNIGKGGAIYDYQACPAGEAAGSANCSNVVRIVF